MRAYVYTHFINKTKYTSIIKQKKGLKTPQMEKIKCQKSLLRIKYKQKKPWKKKVGNPSNQFKRRGGY